MGYSLAQELIPRPPPLEELFVPLASYVSGQGLK